MHICIDGRILEGSLRGMGQTLKALLETVGELDQENQYTILVNDRSRIQAVFADNFCFREIYIPRGIGDLFILAYHINKLNPDVVYFPENIVVPFIKRHTKVLVTIHDLMFFTEEYRPFTRQWLGAAYRRFGAKVAFRRADCIHTYTKYVMDEIRSRSCRQDQRFFLNLQGTPRMRELSQTVFENLPEKGFFYTISGDAPNKGFPFLLDAYAEYRRRTESPLNLYVTGVKNRVQADGVFYTGYISEEEKRFLLQRCQTFIFFSKAEGFGIPPLEALYSHKRPLLTNIPVLRELYDDLAVFVAFANVEEAANALCQMEDQSKCFFDEMQMLEKFSWKHIARRFLEELDLLANGNPLTLNK